VRTDKNFPCGLMDVLTIERSAENYRILYDVKGRFTLHRITKEEAAYKLCKVTQYSTGKKATIGKNPFAHGQHGAIPYVVTHDGRTIRYPDPDVAVNDTVRVNLVTGQITGSIKFQTGNLCLVNRGANRGRIGTLLNVEKHVGSYHIVHLKDRKGNAFATRLTNVMVVGEGNKPWISLPRGKGVRESIMESMKKPADAAKEAKAAAKAE
jgi:small subunit ribosomal protein S4e